MNAMTRMLSMCILFTQRLHSPSLAVPPMTLIDVFVNPIRHNAHPAYANFDHTGSATARVQALSLRLEYS